MCRCARDTPDEKIRGSQRRSCLGRAAAHHLREQDAAYSDSTRRRCRAGETRRAMETWISWERSLCGVSVGARPLVDTDATRDWRCRWDSSLCLFPSPPPPLSLSPSPSFVFSPFPSRARYENELLAHCTRTRSESTGTRYRGRSRFPFEISFSARIRYRHRISVGRGGRGRGKGARSSFTRGGWLRDVAPRTVPLLRGFRPSDSLLRGYFYLNASTSPSLPLLPPPHQRLPAK